MDLILRQVPASGVRPLRLAVLRPGRLPDAVHYPGDDDPDALHATASAADDPRVLGVATVLRQPPRGQDDPHAWRVRGMATLPEVRGQGVGYALLRVCIGWAAHHGGTRVWCAARAGAVGFYEHYGFSVHGGVYEIPDIGPHYFMERPLSHADPRLAADLVLADAAPPTPPAPATPPDMG